MFDSYEGNTEDYSNLKSDNKEHARTSIESLKRFAREMAATPVDTVKRKQIKAWMRDPYRRAPNKAQYWPQPNDKARRELEDSKLWLLANAHEMPRELEDDAGRQYHSALSGPEVAGGNREFYLVDDTGASVDGDEGNPFAQERDIDFSAIGRRAEGLSVWEEHGKSFLGGHSCYLWDAQLAREIGYRDPEYRKHIRSYGLTPHARRILRAERARLFKAHQERQAKALRWTGMQEYDAVGKATAQQEKGRSRTKDVSNAKPLPPIADLQNLFVVDAEDNLINRRLGRAVTGKKVKIAGQLYVTSRVRFAVATGTDPGTKMVRGDVASHYRKAEGSVRFDRATDGVTYREARVRLGAETITVGKYADREEVDREGRVLTINVAEEAAKLYIKSLEMNNG